MNKRMEPATGESNGLAGVDPLALAHRRPDLSAAAPLTVPQKALAVILSLVLLGLAGFFPRETACGFVILSTLFYGILTAYKVWIVTAAAEAPEAAGAAGAEDASGRGRTDWPVYSVLVPMYREPAIVPHMLGALLAMDYPRERMDVLFLLEEEDHATREAFARRDLPASFRVIVAPDSFPRTKPKACNLGLHLARGRYLVIYDAEDRPEPDQLKKAVRGFEEVGPEVVCLQSRLNFYNPRQNLLTRWFAAEYSSWYDLYLPGLAKVDAPIPLGGTSNHFKIDVLRRLMGWDAYNVTEDCDLGVRLCRAGYSTRMLDTTTWEEACASLPFWIRQRTRWIKGYLQTYLVHMRRPVRLLRELGLRRFLHFQLLIGGSFVCFLLNPLFWALALLWFAVRPAGLDALFPGPVFALGALCLFVGNFVFVYVNLLGCFRRGRDGLMWANLLAPLYWALMSFSGWRAFLQFFSNPFYWEKTQHGLFTPKKTR